jgi:hypothetical protein
VQDYQDDHYAGGTHGGCRKGRTEHNEAFDMHLPATAAHISFGGAREGAARALLRWISQGPDADQMWLQFIAYWDHVNYAAHVCVLINMINPAAWPKPLFEGWCEADGPAAAILMRCTAACFFCL